MNNKINQGFPPIVGPLRGPGGIGGPAQPQPQPQTPASGPGSFAEILKEKVGLKFSEHAADRLKGRNLQMSPADMAKLEGAVETARGKGARESLVVMNNTALIVSIKNNTVVTAMGVDEMKDKLVTNIDSAMII
ncbi:MAG: flagellar protein [Nitrospirota bacterium]|nr:flagellar protein [Nitrospirota bacterium]